METEQQPDVVARQQTRLNTAARTAPPEARNSVQELATELEEIRKLPVIPKQRIRAFFNKLATAAFDVKGGIALCRELHDIGYILRQNLVEVREQADENVKEEDNGGIKAEAADFGVNQEIAENIQKEDTGGVEGEVASSDPIERDSNGTNGILGAVVEAAPRAGASNSNNLMLAGVQGTALARPDRVLYRAPSAATTAGVNRNPARNPTASGNQSAAVNPAIPTGPARGNEMVSRRRRRGERLGRGGRRGQGEHRTPLCNRCWNTGRGGTCNGRQPSCNNCPRGGCFYENCPAGAECQDPRCVRRHRDAGGSRLPARR